MQLYSRRGHPTPLIGGGSLSAGLWRRAVPPSMHPSTPVNWGTMATLASVMQLVRGMPQHPSYPAPATSVATSGGGAHFGVQC